MKVLLIVSSYAPNAGGLQTVTRQLAKELHARGHEVAVIANRYPRTLATHEVLDDVPVIRWHFLTPRWQQLLNLRLDLFLAGLLYLPLTLARLVFLLRRERPDVVNLHFVGAPGLFVLLARWFRSFRLVVSVHGNDVEGLPGRGRFDHWVFRSLLRRADAVTACSRYLLGRAIAFEPLMAPKGRAIHNGIEPIKGIAGSGKRTTIFAAGRMIPNKGFDVLLMAYAKCKKRSSLTLIGDGPERQKLERLARSLGLNGEIRISDAPNRAAMLEEMAAAQLVVIPSRQETFGLVAVEAMALGKPVVATRIGGLPEVLAGADALLVEPESPAELSAAIEAVLARLQKDPQFGKRNGDCAAQFSTERMTDGYLEAYRA